MRFLLPTFCLFAAAEAAASGTGAAAGLAPTAPPNADLAAAESLLAAAQKENEQLKLELAEARKAREEDSKQFSLVHKDLSDKLAKLEAGKGKRATTNPVATPTYYELALQHQALVKEGKHDEAAKFHDEKIKTFKGD